MKRVAFFGEEFLQGGIVFDDAVVNQGDPAGVVGVRVGIDFGGSAVGRPAGVGHASLGRGQRLAVGSGRFPAR